MNNKSELPDFVMYQLLENVMDMIHDGVLVVNIKFDIMYINAYANNLLINKNNITNLLLLFPQLNFLHDANEEFFKNRKIEINISENKTEKHLEFIFNTVSKENQYFHLIIINNIMQKKDEHKTSGKCLMAYLSHELRNPLQSITLASHLVKTGIKSFEEKTDLKIPPKLITHINTVNKSCHDMKIIINDILDLSRIEANELVIEMEICYINDIIDSVIDDNIHESSQKGLNFIKIIEKNVPKTIFTDMTRINQILCNLVSNSIKYSEKGNFEFVIPCEGSVVFPYVVGLVKNAPDKEKAKKVLDYLLSDKGQAIWTNAYLRPARPIELPETVKKKFLPDSDYARAKSVDWGQMENMQKGFVDRYLAEVR